MDNVLAVMATCGMYDFSGEWLYRTGLPAKSGVGGGILAVAARARSASASFRRGSTHRATACGASRPAANWPPISACTCSTPSQRAVPAMRLATTRRSVASKRRRVARSRPSTCGTWETDFASTIFRVRSAFASIEPVVRELMAHAADTDYFIVNLRMVQRIDAPRRACSRRRATSVPRRGKTLVLHRGQRVVAAADRRRRRSRRVLRGRRLRAGTRREPAARQRFPDQAWEAQVPLASARCSRGSPASELALLERLLERAGPITAGRRSSRPARSGRTLRHHGGLGHGEHSHAGRHRPRSTPSRPA